MPEHPAGVFVTVLLDVLERRLMAYLTLSKLTEQLLEARRRDLLERGGVPSVVEVAELTELSHELERGRRGARKDEESLWEIRNALERLKEGH